VKADAPRLQNNPNEMGASMNWEAIGAVGELAGAGGVIISLLYLGIQIKRQSIENRFAAVHEYVNETNIFFGSAAENKEVAEIWVRGIENFDSLDKVEKARFLADLSRTFRSMEGLLYLYLRGRLDSTMWKGIDHSTRDLCKCAGVKKFWSMRKHWYSDELNDYIDQYIDLGSSDAAFAGTYGQAN
jgi:hypothetical protein